MALTCGDDAREPFWARPDANLMWPKSQTVILSRSFRDTRVKRDSFLVVLSD
jgi:hypothetical protein